MEKEKIDLSKPAFGVGSQKIEATPVETVVEPEVKAKEVAEETSEEESKVPYSRFKKFHDDARRFEQEAQEWRAKAEAIESKRQEPQIDFQDEAYKLWIENYGDNEASRKAWKNQLKITETLEERALERAREGALEAVRNERYEEAQRTEANVETLDNNFEDLSTFVGRDLTEKEQSAILDIVDDYTPKDREGNYAGEILAFDKAWEIYELRNQASQAPKVQSRNAVAGLSGSASQGDTAQAERDKNFIPGRWDSYKDRL